MALLEFLGPIGGILGLVKIGLVVGALGAVTVTGYKVVDFVKVSEQNKVILMQQQEALMQNQIVIDRLQADMQLRDKAVQDQQKTIDELNTSLQDVTKNLSEDAESQAPNSIKQVIDRLHALETNKPK